MLRLVLWTTLIGFGLCYTQLQLQEDWSGWKTLHSKSYFTGEEENSRWIVWRENYDKIMEHNKVNHSFSLGLNQFADLVCNEIHYVLGNILAS